MAGNSITFLGTGNALVKHCYNTCFWLNTPECQLLVDAGGGNGIFTQLDKAGIKIADIHHLFLTHAHTDHLLGAVWVVRLIAQQYLKGKYEGELHIYGHHRVLQCLTDICAMLLPKKIQLFGTQAILHELTDGDSFAIGNVQFTAFDIHSTKEQQFGFRAELQQGLSLVCLGDEPFNEANRALATGADWLLSEAFCLYAERDEFKPYEKSHSTALDAGRLAAELGTKNLVLYHTEEKNLSRRKELYTAEARTAFSGNIFVPDDLETISLD